ncbi:MAG: RNA methyltransferase [Candidatus Micrarchaeia archaeon]
MLRVVLVQPEHAWNIGSVARAMKNFGFLDLWIVQPKCKITGDTVKFAKHSQEVLNEEKVVQSVEDAVKDCTTLIGTTASTSRYRKKTLKKCVSTAELSKHLSKNEKTAILFGSESAGLDEKTTALCDLMVCIPSSKMHTVLNLSHAVAIVLYELFKNKAKKPKTFYQAALKSKRTILEKKFEKVANELKNVKQPKKVSLAFRRICDRAKISDDEAQTLFAALSELEKKL